MDVKRKSSSGGALGQAGRQSLFKLDEWARKIRKITASRDEKGEGWLVGVKLATGMFGPVPPIYPMQMESDALPFVIPTGA